MSILQNLTSKKTKNIKDKSDVMDKLLKENATLKLPKVGDLVEGKVISASKNEVHVDINGIATGVVRGKEIYDESDSHSGLKIGDMVCSTVLELENENGELELSFRFAGHQKAWDNLKELQENDETVEAKVIDANRGGLMIKVGNVVGFMPVSQLAIEHYPRVEGGDKNKILSHLKDFVGKSLKTKIIDANENDDKLIVSEKSAFEEKQLTSVSKFKIGDIVEGIITGVVDFGAFVEFGNNLEGLVHISELAWQRIDNPRDIIKVGDKIKAEIIEIDGSKISLSIKKLNKDPWQNVMKKYKIDQLVSGKVIKINPFGAFVELDEDIHGLVHISEISPVSSKKPGGKEKPQTTTKTEGKPLIEIGKTYKFSIISIEPNEHRLGLSLKATKEKGAKEIKSDSKTKSSDKSAETSKTDSDLKKDKASETTPKEKVATKAKTQEEKGSSLATPTDEKLTTEEKKKTETKKKDN